ncbi:MAG: hypothetical protein ACFFCZ_01230 [Promethearchaeota archaeon]
MKNDHFTENWYCKKCNVKNIPRSYRNMTAEFSISEDINHSIDNIIAIKKIELSEREKAIELANRLKARNISPIILIAVECPLCSEKNIAPKIKDIEPSAKIKKAQFRTVSGISKKATTQMRAKLKNTSDGKNFFQRFPIWTILLALAVLLTIIAAILSQLGII